MIKKYFPDIYFGKKYNYKILHVLTYQICYFCKLALETEVIHYTSAYSGRVYQIKNIKNLSKLEEKINRLKNSIIKIKIK